MAAAEAAWPAWAAMTATERVGIVLKALETLETDQDARTDILSRENGKIRFEAFIDLIVFSGRFHQAAQYAPELDDEEHIAGPPFNTTITKLSRGVVTIIYPFNWPLAILAASLPAALMSGNTVIVKPPPTTPLSSVQTLRHLVRACRRECSTWSPARTTWSAPSSSATRGSGTSASPARSAAASGS